MTMSGMDGVVTMALMLDFTGRYVFVFGYTTGIGFGVAENFSKHCANVYGQS